VTALSEALVAAQRQAIAALEKAYVGGQLDDDGLAKALDAIGCADTVDGLHLLAALDVLKAWGTPPPVNGGYAERRETLPMDGGDDVADNVVPLGQICHEAITRRAEIQSKRLLASLTDPQRAYGIDYRR
jgi:hypothetical protein